MSPTIYSETRQRYDREINILGEGIKKQATHEVESIHLALNILELASKSKESYLTKFNNEQKRRFLKLVFSNFFIEGKVVNMTLKNGFKEAALLKSGAEDGI